MFVFVSLFSHSYYIRSSLLDVVTAATSLALRFSLMGDILPLLRAAVLHFRLFT